MLPTTPLAEAASRAPAATLTSSTWRLWWCSRAGTLRRTSVTAGALRSSFRGQGLSAFAAAGPRAGVKAVPRVLEHLSCAASLTLLLPHTRFHQLPASSQCHPVLTCLRMCLQRMLGPGKENPGRMGKLTLTPLIAFTASCSPLHHSAPTLLCGGSTHHAGRGGHAVRALLDHAL